MASAYFARLEVTTLPFAIDAAHILELVPPKPGSIVLDNACGTGAAVGWIIHEYEKAGVDLRIAATDFSAVMMNEVNTRRERLHWGDNVQTIIMDAQVSSLGIVVMVEPAVSLEYVHSCLYDIWDYVDPGLQRGTKTYSSSPPA